MLKSLSRYALAGLLALGATLSLATPPAEAHDRTGRYIAGTVLGLAAATILAHRHNHYYYNDYYYEYTGYPPHPGGYYGYYGAGADYYYRGRGDESYDSGYSDRSRPRGHCDPKWDPIGQGGVC